MKRWGNAFEKTQGFLQSCAFFFQVLFFFAFSPVCCAQSCHAGKGQQEQQNCCICGIAGLRCVGLCIVSGVAVISIGGL